MGIGEKFIDAPGRTQPVVYELGNLSIPTLLIIGDKDTTAIGKDISPPEVRAKIGNYPELAKAAH